MELRAYERSVQVARVDSGRRVVYGEVMVPAPDGLTPGVRVSKAALAGCIHYDGAFMDRAEIVALADRFARKRPSVDIEHNGVPVGATVVESFIARDGDPDYRPGSWVTGVQVHDPAAWGRVESGELRAFSIQFMVRVEDVPVIFAEDGQPDESTTLYRFSNGDPQYLSLVKNPATGALWKHVERAALPYRGLEVAPLEVDWDPAAAADRVRTWAGGDSMRELEAYAWASDDGIIADVVEGRLMVVARGVEAAVAAAGDDPRRAAHAGAYAQYFDLQRRLSEGDFDPAVEEKQAETSADVARSEEAESAGIAAVATADTNVTISGGENAVVVAPEVRDEHGAASFGQALEGGETMDAVGNAYWKGAGALHATLMGIAGSAEPDRAGKLKAAVNDFAQWMQAQVDALMPLQGDMDQFLAAASADVDRAGAKMSKSRLDKLKAAMSVIKEILDEVEPQMEAAQGYGSKPKKKMRESEADDAVENAIEPAPEVEIERQVPPASSDATAALERRFAELADAVRASEQKMAEQVRYVKDLEALVAARAPHANHGGNAPRRDPREELRGVFFPRVKK